MPPEESNKSKKEQQAPGVGHIQFGELRRLEPLTRSFGYERGQPIDRYYIEKFLHKHTNDIAVHVVEIGDDRYIKQFGGDKVTHPDVLDQAHPGSSPTIIADLTNAGHVPSNTFNCIIAIQTLQFIYDIHAVVSTLHRILKAGGVLLASLSTISQISRYDMDQWGDYWRFTSAAAKRLFSDVFGTDHIQVESYGNVLVSAAFLYGMSTQDLTTEELDFHDKDYEAIICVRAVKE